MHPDIIVWFSGFTILLSALAWWFDTRLAVHFFEFLRLLGWKKRDSSFWSMPSPLGIVIPFGDLTRADLDEWMHLRFHHLVAELLSCPGCLSAHISFWVSVCIQGLFGFNECLFLAGWLGWPGVALLLRGMRSSKG
jgi:hypothetical protein